MRFVLLTPHPARASRTQSNTNWHAVSDLQRWAGLESSVKARKLHSDPCFYKDERDLLASHLRAVASWSNFVLQQSTYFFSSSAIRALISLISRRCASMISSANLRTRGSLI